MGIMEDFYGILAWLFILNFNLPLQLFFFFHSSVCFADIWSMAYKPVQPDFHHVTHSHEHDYMDQHHAPANGHLFPAQIVPNGAPANGQVPSAFKNKGVANKGFYLEAGTQPQLNSITEGYDEVFEPPDDTERL